MRFRSKLPELYGTDGKILELSTNYSVLIESLCSEEDRKNIETLGHLNHIVQFTEFGIKKGIKEEKNGGNIYRDMFFESAGFEPPKFDPEHVKEVRKELEKLEEKCRVIEIVPRSKKELSQLSENTSIPIGELEKYVRRAEKDKVIERTKSSSYQLTTKGLEVAYVVFSGRDETDDSFVKKRI
jgi:hypothetical protein